MPPMDNSAQRVMYPTSERQRPLQPLDFAASQILTRALPVDTVLKSIMIRLSGSVITTYASGTPVADAQSIFDNLVQRIEIVVGGDRTVKSVRPHLMQMQQIFHAGLIAERRCSAGAAAATDNLPTADAGFTYGTTGQVTTVAESVTVHFEMIYAESGLGRESTWLNLKGRSSAVLNIVTNAFSALLGYGNTAPVVYSGSTLRFEIFTLEAQDVPPNMVFADWRQTTFSTSFSAQASQQAIKLNTGQRMSGLMLFARDGAAGTATTASGKVASNLLITDLQLMVNGQTSIKSTNFKALQAENRRSYGVNAPFASNVSRIDGVAHLNLLARKDLTTALSTEGPLVDQLQLIVTTNSASNVSYTNPAELVIMQEEIVYPR